MRRVISAVILFQMIQAYSYIDGPVEMTKVEDWHCPGLYCGRSLLNETHYTACGKCLRGWRVSNNTHSICHECSTEPKSQEWLFLAFHVVLVLVLHWIAIDMTAMRRKMTKAVLAVHIGATLEVGIAAIITLLVTNPTGHLKLHACRVNRLSDWYTYFHNPNPNYQKTLNW